MTQLVLTAWPGLPGPQPASGRLLGRREEERETPVLQLGGGAL